MALIAIILYLISPPSSRPVFHWATAPQTQSMPNHKVSVLSIFLLTALFLPLSGINTTSNPVVQIRMCGLTSENSFPSPFCSAH